MISVSSNVGSMNMAAAAAAAAAALRASAGGRSTWRSFSGLSSCSSNQTKPHKDNKPKRSALRPAPSTTTDWIGPPNPLSNLRPVVYHVPENESELEKRLRNLRQETEDWNHEFWTKQNITFTQQKEAFIISQLNAKGLTLRDEDGRRRSLNIEEMAVFYKSFLDKNRTRHANYNKEWYRRNFTITLLMARVTLNGMWRTVSERYSSKKSSSPPT